MDKALEYELNKIEEKAGKFVEDIKVNEEDI